MLDLALILFEFLNEEARISLKCEDTPKEAITVRYWSGSSSSLSIYGFGTIYVPKTSSELHLSTMIGEFIINVAQPNSLNYILKILNKSHRFYHKNYLGNKQCKNKQ